MFYIFVSATAAGAGSYCGGAGLAGQDTAGLLLGHVEVLLVSVVDTLGQ